MDASREPTNNELLIHLTYIRARVDETKSFVENGLHDHETRIRTLEKRPVAATKASSGRWGTLGGFLGGLLSGFLGSRAAG